jgi:hypothetical protein
VVIQGRDDVVEDLGDCRCRLSAFAGTLYHLRRLIAPRLALGVLVTIAATLMGALPLYVVGSLIAGLGFGAAFRFAVNALGETAPVTQGGAVFATTYIASYLAFSVPALAAGLAVGRFGLKATAVTYGALEVALVLVAMVAAIVRARRRVSENEPRPSSATPLVSRTFITPPQTTHYIECGPVDGPLMIFLHGWPSIGLIWHAQMDAFAAEGWHCVAPDLRGYGGSSAPAGNDAYTIEEVVADMAELHDHLGGNAAIWVGHDWGTMTPTSPTRAKHPMAAASRSRCCSSTASGMPSAASPEIAKATQCARPAQILL